MQDDRLFASIALLCVLFWLLARHGGLGRRLSHLLEWTAILLLVAGLCLAAFLAISQ